MDQTKARLLEAAGEEFAEKGFGGATVRAICDRAGVNLAAINYHFGGKEQLYVQAVLASHRCGAGELVPDEAFLAGEPADQLRGFIRFFLTNILAMGGTASWQHALMLREMIQPTDACGTLVNEVIRPRFERLVAILRRVCPEAEAKRLHAIGFSVIGQLLHYKVARPIIDRLLGPEESAGFDLEFLTEHIAGFTLAALGLAPPLDASGAPPVPRPRREVPCTGSR